MSKKVFVSYSHKQSEWVRSRLIPCLRYGGAEVEIDYERFKAGLAVIGQMDRAQDEAEASVLVLSEDYLKSHYCHHEMTRAIIRDPDFTKGSAVFVKRVECEMPEEVKAAAPLWIDLCDDRDAAQWSLLMQACNADLGVNAPDWIEARDESIRLLARDQSVNLVVNGAPQWQPLIKHIRDDHFSDLGIMNLDQGSTASRSGLVTEILKVCGFTTHVPDPPNDLGILDRTLSVRGQSKVALLHFDHAKDRDYGLDLFAALRYLIMESRKLVLLIQSRRPFIELLPHDHPLSAIDIKTVELRGR